MQICRRRREIFMTFLSFGIWIIIVSEAAPRTPSICAQGWCHNHDRILSMNVVQSTHSLTWIWEEKRLSLVLPRWNVISPRWPGVLLLPCSLNRSALPTPFFSFSSTCNNPHGNAINPLFFCGCTCCFLSNLDVWRGWKERSKTRSHMIPCLLSLNF